MFASAQKVLQFGRFSFNPNTASLSCEGREIRLRHKSFDVLLYLARNPGRVVSKGELIEAVWPNIFVTERCPDIANALHQRIVRDEGVGPDGLDQFVLSDDSARIAGEEEQDIEGFVP